MYEITQESSKQLSSESVAHMESGFGIALLLMVLTFITEARELKNLAMLAFAQFFIIMIYFGSKAVMGETPKWSGNAKRSNGIGTTVLFPGGTIGVTFNSLVLGIPMMFAGLMLILISTLHPSSRLDKMTSHKEEEDGADGEI